MEPGSRNSGEMSKPWRETRKQVRERHQHEGWVKIIFPLQQDEDGYPPVAEERLWARPVTGGYELDNIPFFAYGVSSGDVVAVEKQQESLIFRELLQTSGHSTVRVLVHDATDVPQVRETLRGFGCESEVGPMRRLVAVDIPPQVPYAEVRALLDRGEADGRWEYEEAALAHKDQP